MSLPNYLAKIKSSGIYRFVWDKSQIPAGYTETLRLVVGYSEKGPFNTPVYVENTADFINIYGNISKRLERKGVYFHRMALQALSAGPILTLNLKPFTDESEKTKINNKIAVLQKEKDAEGTTEERKGKIDEELAVLQEEQLQIKSEKVTGLQFDPKDIYSPFETLKTETQVKDLYDTNKFWELKPEQLPEKLSHNNKYVVMTSTDTKELSCSVFLRKSKNASRYDLTIRQWFTNVNEEMPEYLESIKDKKLSDYFMDVYVFRGKFTPDICKKGSLLEHYFDVNENTVTLKNTCTNAFGEEVDALEALSDDENSNFIQSYQGCLFPAFKDINGRYISLDILFNADHYRHKLLMKLNESMLDDIDEEAFNTLFNYPEEPKSLVPMYLEGYTYYTINKSKDSNANIINSSLSVLDTKGIREALTNRVDVDYHYLVDTYDSLISYNENNNCKAKLAYIAKLKDNAFAILNFPKMSEFVNNEQFKSVIANEKKFDIDLVPKYFSLPNEYEGASFCGFFTQLTFSDGTIKRVVPSAGLVSNNFIEKYESRQPYYIVAGPNYGRLAYNGMIGPDYNFSRSDLDVLEPMGVNAIVYVPRKGTYINSNQTAKQTPVSALSKIHVRELAIFIQDEIEKLLQNYQWELNTQTLRDTIKTKADSILETIKNNGGVYEYLNICDESNNTPEVIDNEMIILDTEIEPARGAGKMVHQLTIRRTGEISSMVK